MISEKRLRGLAIKPELAQKVVDYAQQVCPECTALISTLVTGAYPDYDALVTLYNVSSDKIMDVQHTVRRFCRNIQRKHSVSIAIQAFDPEQTEKYHKKELKEKTPRVNTPSEKRLRGLEIRPYLAQRVVNYAQQICPECTVLISTLVTGAYPDYDALVTLYSVPTDKIMDVRHTVRRFCRDIQRKHSISVAIQAFDPEQTEKYHQKELKEKTPRINPP